MKTKLAVGTRRLSTFDRVGVVIVAVLGTLAGLVAPGLHSIISSPMPLLLFPGLLVGWPAAHLFGMTVGVLACGVANGAACGFLMYAWRRLANAIAARIPIWFQMSGSLVAGSEAAVSVKGAIVRFRLLLAGTSVSG